MKITNVEMLVFTKKHPVIQYAEDIPAIIKEMEVMVLRIMTDEGVEGNSGTLGYTGSVAPDVRAIETAIKPLLIGENPLLREKLWQKVWRTDRLAFLPQTAWGPVDVALWDLAGKVANMPLYQMLGGYRETLPAYASSQTQASVEAYVEEALRNKEKGYKAYKLHPFGDPKRDIAACKAVRKAVGDDYVLMLDAVASYDYPSALKVGRALEELNFCWFEEPMRDTDIYGYKKLAKDLDIPIAGVEVIPGSMFTTPEYLVTNAVDIVRSDVMFKGGITPVIKTAHMAEAFGMKLEIHTIGGHELMEAANLHVVCAIKNSDYYEILVPEDVFQYGISERINIDREGNVHVPKGPGLGLEVDWDYVKANLKYKV